MSDDVRARAEAQLRAVIEAMDDPAIGDIVRALPECERLRAALAAEAADASASPRLAVAPATAQPVAWVVMGNRGTRRSPPYLSREDAERCVMELDRGEFLEDIAQTPHRVVPLYAAPPPATGDAAAVREACAALFDPLTTDVEIRRKLGREGMKEAAAAIRALPLPAPATAVVGSVSDQAPDEGSSRVEEARKAFYEAARAMMHAKRTEAAEADWDDALAAAVVKTTKAASRAYYDVLNAEAADEGHTLAAKESRSDDRPAAGQGGGRG